MENTEREDLEALLRSAGWARFQQHVQSEWGTADGGGQRFLLAVTKAANHTDDAMATGQLRQIIAAQREIQTLMAWVGQRLQQVTPDKDYERPHSRRGGL